ncbi:uncharacterized protein DNG_09748 [Cephalotrichum gorgonifer]|uniref:NACHT domain-containing protein n=1 Tax=Cephalotrichum gorgonifer TaxID=2041049 RepID=A0AAE8N7T0_9PEZI|nr:uncharacterized protein DNG_09748 [Cephalotrichum gorgonifer]
MASPDPLQKIFNDVKADFERSLPANTPFRDVLAAGTLDKIWDTVDKLQRDQGKVNHLRHLLRIQPYLERLQGFSATIEVFVSSKAEVLALIWGPIKLLLMWTSEWQQGFNAVVQTMERIGDLLPQFSDVLVHFVDKKLIRDVLGLFYRDILDFYLEGLKLFGLSRRKIMFETLWPRSKEKLKVIEGNIERHAQLLGSNITFEHIKREADARVSSLKEFRESELARAKQKFQALETAICPPVYDDRLDWLRTRTCPGTAKWLAQDQVFNQWMDLSSQATRLLWLQGIPGAGKTFLASWVVAKAKEKGRTIYAFPSHVHSNTTAKSVIHSLLFQLASDDVDLQAIITDSNKRDLKSDMAVAKEVLKSALQFAGGAFIVVDGLDEVEKVERQQLLQSLMDILNACGELGLRICIASRPEDDIAKILRRRGATIRVDGNNSLGIQTYINKRYEEWMNNTDFLDEGKKEIKAFLYPLVTKAKGMFLYARIVIDNVADLNSIDDIRKELRVLPEDLDDAMVKRIIGWIGCSPTPLKVYELEQALLVNDRRHADAPVVDSSLNIVELCGPIVEVVGEMPQFVHFTVKEYAFDGRSGFTSMIESTMDLLVACLTYLCYDALRDDLDDDQLRDNILSGKYRFQAFASSSWLILATKYARLTRDRSNLASINLLMQNLSDELTNPKFRNESGKDAGQDQVLASRANRLWPGAPEFVTNSFRFHNSHTQDLWTMNNAETWTHLDPLLVSSSCARVEAFYITLLCHQKDTEHKADCKTNHSRPWKCSVKSCDFSIIGYLSQEALDNHRKRVHRAIRETATTEASALDDEALYPLLYDLVGTGDIDELEAVWQTCRERVNDFTHAELVTMAAGQGSLPIVKLLLEWDDEKQGPRSPAVKFNAVVHDAVQSGNLELTRWILARATARGCNPATRYRETVVAVLKSDSTEVFNIWHSMIIVSGESLDNYLFPELFEKTVLTTARRFPDQEMRLFETWRSLVGLGKAWEADLGRALTLVAQTTLSIEQAKVLLELGAPIDYPNWKGGRGYTSLHWAAKKTSSEAAQFMKFLLLQGANPGLAFGIACAEKEAGARNIETWLDMTWEELVRWAEAQRETAKNYVE